MENMDWLEKVNNKFVLNEISKTNNYSNQFGLVLTNEDAQLLLKEKADILKKEKRVEFGESVLPKIIYAFCDSEYISQNNYVDTLIRLQEIFFLYKNETEDKVTDEELINFMKEQFDGVCFGDLEYLETTCLEIFAEAVRAGYSEYQATEGKGEFSKMDIAKRWDKELYFKALEDL